MKRIMNSPFASLIIRDLSVRYVGSYMGITWAIIQPAVTVIILWVVFSLGFKVEPRVGVGFMEWLIPGYIAWQYFSEAVSGGTQGIIESSYLVKKIAFRVERLPAVKIMSAMAVHIILVAIVLIVEDGAPVMKRLQVVYYMIGLSSLAYGIVLITSALSVFTRDVVQIVGMSLQLGFWGTPIFWEEGMLPTEYRWIVELNPLSYIVEGYRQSMLGGAWFWERPETVTYWVETLIIILIGRRVFRRMRPHFADVI